MHFEIDHRMEFQYSRPIFIEPMTVRLTPASTRRQRLIDYSLAIHAPPAGLTPCADLEGNATHHAWFLGHHAALSIHAHAIVETLCANPFDYLLTGAATLPAEYPPELAAPLAVCRATTRGPAVEALVEDLLRTTGGHTLDFLFALTQRIHATLRYVERLEGPAWPAERTLGEGCGSCRDSAVLFMDACRCAGLAARFVSGYKHELDGAQSANLHAWAEVYLPGAGWRGYDPSLGLVAADRHIVLAVSADPELAAPTSGRYRGTGAHSELNCRIVIRDLDAPGTATPGP